MAKRPLLWLVLLALFVPAAAACAAVSRPQGWAGPTLEGGALYVSIERGKMAALDPADLSLSWVFPPDTREGKRIKPEAIYGAPVVTKDSLYFGGYDGNVYAVSALDGSLRWVFEGAGGPIIGGVTLYDPDPKNHPERAALFVGSDDGKLYALDPETGREKRPAFRAGDSIWAKPLIADDVIYVPAVNGKLHALDIETLEPVWDEPFEADAGLVTDPVLAGDTLLVGGIDRTLYALDAATGKAKWSYEGDNWFWGRPLVADGIVYVPNLDKHVYALNLSDGEPAWPEPFEADAPVRSSPLLVGEMLIVADRSGHVYGVDREEGVRRWGPEILDARVLSDPFLLEEDVLVVAQGGDLYRVDPEGGRSSLVEVRQP